jgi:F-type H+-transporting ATPase subunit b
MNRSRAAKKLWVAAVLSLMFVATVRVGNAQESEPPKPSTAAASDQNRYDTQSLGGELAKESREAAGEDESAEFKKSPSVQLIARITGLSLVHAYWLCVVLNFALIAGMIFWASKKYLPGMFRNRTVSIQKAMAEARAASDDANRRLAEIEVRLSRLDGEISEMRGAAEMEAMAEEERIKAATAEEIRRVVDSAEQEISAATKHARRDLRAYAANLVVSLAEKQIKVDSATDQSLVKGFTQHLSSDEAGRRDGR